MLSFLSEAPLCVLNHGIHGGAGTRAFAKRIPGIRGCSLVVGEGARQGAGDLAGPRLGKEP